MLINKSFTFVQCSECSRTIKVNVGVDICIIKCTCETEKIITEPKVIEKAPIKRTVRKAEEDGTV